MKPRLYDRNMNFVCVLNNATAVSYTKKFNDLHIAQFELPIDDPDVAKCQTQYIVDIFDGNRSVGKYRILDQPEVQLTASSPFAKFSCEHVIAFLLNDVIDGYLQVGGTECNTGAVIQKLLDLQTTKRWRLGTCEADAKFQYSWQNTNICDALFSVTSCFDVDYHWTYDTDSYPWKVNLLALPTASRCMIIKGKNMQQIKRTKDASQLCTRLYCKGYGEGVNQLTIKDVNNGLPYIDADTIDKYGVMCSHYIDTTITDAETLLAKGKRVLNLYKEPRYTYTAKAIDLYRMTGKTIDHFDEGLYVRILDSEKDINVDAKIIEVTKKNVDGDPLDVDITISNKDEDTADTIDDLAKRTAITSQYSQGATNLYSLQFADNADADNAAQMKFFIPTSCVRINQVLLNWQATKFRAYSKSASTSAGTTQTSSESGGATVTSASGGGTTKTISQSCRVITSIGSPTDVTGSGVISSTGSAGEHTHAWSYSMAWGHSHYTSSSFTAGSNTGGVVSYSAKKLSGTTDSAGSHSHSFTHSHSAVSSVTIPDLTITLEDHTHEITVNSHSHTVTVPSHSHSIEYGIYKGGTAQSCTIKVDGTIAIENASKGTDIDIVPYLSKDSNGKINRNTWHSIEIVPDRITRIEANLFVQTFVTSYEGGNY